MPDNLIEYHPSPRQRAFHRDPRPWVWYCGGWGSGKTTALVFEAVANSCVRHPGYTGIVAAPTFQLLNQAWFTEWRKQVPRAVWSMRGSPTQGGCLQVRTPGGLVSTILLRSTSVPWSNEGVNAAWLVFDEASRERSRESFDVLVARVRVGHPGRQQRIVLSGPPMTRRHWTAKEFGAGPDAKHAGDFLCWHDNVHSVVRSRTRDNPYLKPGYEEQIRTRPGSSRAWCAQWLDAEFGSAEGQIYEAFSRDVHIVDASALACRAWRQVIAGVDWGWEHPGVMIVVGVDGTGDVTILHEEVHQHKVVADLRDGWVPIAQRLCADWHVSQFYCDPSQPGNIETLQRGVRGRARVYDAENDVAEGLRVVTALLESAVDRSRGLARRAPALYVSSACERMVEEFESYARRRDRHGELTEEPEERGDDCADALRYAAMGLVRI